MNKQHFKKHDTVVTWSLLLTDTGYRHHFSENELYSFVGDKK